MQEIPSGNLFSFKTSAIIFWQAMLHKGAFSEAFQMQTSPQIQDNAVFQAQTATGKLNADIMPTMPKGVILIVHSMSWTLGMHGKTV